jgi:hypothetical protein
MPAIIKIVLIIQQRTKSLKMDPIYIFNNSHLINNRIWYLQDLWFLQNNGLTKVMCMNKKPKVF